MTYTEYAGIAVAVILSIVLVLIIMFRKNNIFKREKNNNSSIIKAVKALVYNNDNTALEYFSSIAKSSESASIETLLILGFLRRKMGDYTRSAQIYEMILGDNSLPKDFSNELKSEIAFDYMMAGQYAKAVDLIKNNSALMKMPENILTLAKCYLAVQNWDGAVSYYNKYYKLTNNKIYGFYEKCLLSKAVNMHTNEIAVKYIKDVINTNSKCRPARIMYAIGLLNTDKTLKAVEEFKDIIKEGLLRDFNDFEYVKKTYIKAGKEGELTELLREETHKGNINPIVHIALAEYYNNNNDFITAKSVLEAYIELPDMKVIAGKVYAEKVKDKVSSNILKNVRSYKCVCCGYETDTYKDDCPKCSAFDSIYFN